MPIFRRRRRQLDDYEPRTTLLLRRHARRTGNDDLLAALDDPDFRRAANAEIINLAEEDGVDVDSDRPFRDWLLSILEALKPAIIQVITALLESWLGGMVPGFSPQAAPAVQQCGAKPATKKRR